jgi:1-acyl-sn-glycerol-3-phosphate acyltransferase
MPSSALLRVSLEQWRALVAVVDAGGYAQAAEALHKSQSALTYAVQKLESQLAVKAFEIRGRKAVLTPTGQMLYRRARALLDEAAGVEQAARATSAGWEAEIRLAVEVLFPTWLLLECLQRFSVECPHTRIEVIESVLGGFPGVREVFTVDGKVMGVPALVDNLTRSKVIRAAVIYAALRIAAFVIGLLIGLRVTGRAHIPVAGPIIVSPNHQTYLDGFFVAAALPFHAFRRIFFVGAAEYFETPVMARGAHAINIVPVDPDANLVNAMQAAATGLRLGKVLMLFPEGERTIDGAVKTFRKGAVILASHLNAPVVPVGLDGLFPLWPRGRAFQWSQLFRLRRRGVRLTFGPPIRFSSTDYAAGALELQTRVTEMIRNRVS